jgi:hypothetical protein
MIMPVTSPQKPSEQFALAPMVYSVASAIAFPFRAAAGCRLHQAGYNDTARS